MAGAGSGRGPVAGSTGAGHMRAGRLAWSARPWHLELECAGLEQTAASQHEMNNTTCSDSEAFRGAHAHMHAAWLAGAEGPRECAPANRGWGGGARIRIQSLRSQPLVRGHGHWRMPTCMCARACMAGPHAASCCARASEGRFATARAHTWATLI